MTGDVIDIAIPRVKNDLRKQGCGTPSDGTKVNPARLTEARELRGLSLGELAKKTGLPRGALIRYEDGRLNPTEGPLIKLQNALSLPASFFFQPDRHRSSSKMIVCVGINERLYEDCDAVEALEQIRRFVRPRVGKNSVLRQVLDLANIGLGKGAGR